MKTSEVISEIREAIWSAWDCRDSSYPAFSLHADYREKDPIKVLVTCADGDRFRVTVERID